MSVTSFAKAIDNIATTVSTAYTAGSGSLTVASASGITLSAGQWVRVSIVRSGVPVTILKATAVSGNVLTIASAVDGYTDVNLLVGDAAELRVTAGAFNDLATAVNTLESSGGAGLTIGNTVSGGTNNSVLYVNGSGHLADTGLTFDGTTFTAPTINVSATSGADLVNFVVSTPTTQNGYFRLENRSSARIDTNNSSGEWQFMHITPTGPYTSTSNIARPLSFGAGSVLVGDNGNYGSPNTGDYQKNFPNLAIGGLPIDTATRVTIYSVAAGNKGLVIQQAASPTALPFQVQNSSASTLMSVRPDGSLNLPVIANASAVNSSLFIDSSASNKLCWKDSGGTLHYST